MSDLKPCPFCGSDDILLQSFYAGFEEAQCGSCGVVIQRADTKGLYVAWNTRATESGESKRLIISSLAALPGEE